MWSQEQVIAGGNVGSKEKHLRILFLAFRDSRNRYIGGGDIYINELAKGCVNRGHDVTFVSSRFPGCKAEESVDGVYTIRFGSPFTMFFMLFFYYFAHFRGRFDVVVEDVLSGPRIPFFGSLYIGKRTVGIIFQRQKELFRRQFSYPVAFAMSSVERLLLLVYRRRVIVVDSLEVKKDLQSIGYKANKMIVVHPGVQDLFFPKNPPAPFSERRLQVLCLTKLRRYKLIEDAIFAIEEVRKTLPECQLVIAGRTNEVDPGYEEELRVLADRLNLNENVRFIKDETAEEKAELLASSRILILPSALEGFGIVVIEANAYGTPVVASDGVPADAALNGYNAIVVRRNDIAGYSEAILSLLTDKKRWDLMSNNSVEWASHFKWGSAVEKFLCVLHCADAAGSYALACEDSDDLKGGVAQVSAL
jgi:glycosyltransferase involved in cell wall biosynthesis